MASWTHAQRQSSTRQQAFQCAGYTQGWSRLRSSAAASMYHMQRHRISISTVRLRHMGFAESSGNCRHNLVPRTLLCSLIHGITTRQYRRSFTYCTLVAELLINHFSRHNSWRNLIRKAFRPMHCFYSCPGNSASLQSATLSHSTDGVMGWQVSVLSQDDML